MIRHAILRALRAAVGFVALIAAAVGANTITVNSLADVVADDGACTLREAIIAANTDTTSGAAAGECAAGAGADTIEFGVAGTIMPASGLPVIMTPIHINGYTAPGASKNTLPLAQGTNAVLKIEIDGANAGNIAGLRLTGDGASGSIIEGLVLNNSANPQCCAQIGILTQSVAGAATTIIRGNFISTNVAGTEARSKGSANIFLNGTAANFVIGSGPEGALDDSARNLLSGVYNYSVTASPADNLTIRGNLIGTNAAGTEAIPNGGDGVIVDSLSHSLIAENVISGNQGAGVELRQGSSTTVIRNNLIGTNAAGTGPVPNQFSGILVVDNPFTTGLPISGIDVNDNIVAYNQCQDCSAGIVVGIANPVNTTLGVRLARNLVYGNSGLQIDLATPDGNNFLTFGVTENDAGDADGGPNALQNFPLLSPATGDGTAVAVPYALHSEANKSYRIEFFQTPQCDASGHGGANVYLGAVDVATDGTGDASGTASFASTLRGGFVSATATQTTNGTSEFSLCVVLSEGAIAPVNYQGLWWRFPAGSESGWGINFAHQGDIIFATWFTYDVNGHPLWLAAELHRVAPGVYSGDLFTTTGPPFDAVPFDPKIVVETVVGTMSVTFNDENNATFAYTVNDASQAKLVVSQTKPITRQLFAEPVPHCVWGAALDLAQAVNFQDLWWAAPPGSESGWGVNFTHQGDIIFFTWFTYGADGKPLWLIAVAEKSAPGVYAGPISTVTGPAFNADPWDPGQVVETVVGSTTLIFIDGNHATFTYTVNGVMQTKQITRQVFAAPGTLCQT